jgi:hypothetical protein
LRVQARTGLVTGICGGRSYYGWFSLLEGVRGGWGKGLLGDSVFYSRERYAEGLLLTISMGMVCDDFLGGGTLHLIFSYLSG